MNKAVAILTCVGILACGVALAQQVNRRIGSVSGPTNYSVGRSSGRVNNQVTGGMKSGSVGYSQQYVLPSEALYAYRASGSTPGEVTANYSSLGPMSTGGTISYIPKQSAVQKAYGMEQQSYYKSAYGNNSKSQDDDQPGASPRSYGSGGHWSGMSGGSVGRPSYGGSPLNVSSSVNSLQTPISSKVQTQTPAPASSSVPKSGFSGGSIGYGN